MRLHLLAVNSQRCIVSLAMILAKCLLAVGEVSEADESSRHSGSKTLDGSALFDESILTDNVFRVRQRELKLKDEQHYQYMSD